MDNKILTNCPLCDEHSLHLIGKDEYQMQQCVNCGYVTFEKCKLEGKTKEENEFYLQLTDDMKKWIKLDNDRIWSPSIFTLPNGMLYPIDDEDGNMKWSYAKMVDIPEDEREKYPDGNGNFYERKYDVSNASIHDEFLYAFSQLNEDSKSEDKL